MSHFKKKNHVLRIVPQLLILYVCFLCFPPLIKLASVFLLCCSLIKSNILSQCLDSNSFTVSLINFCFYICYISPSTVFQFILFLLFNFCGWAFIFSYSFLLLNFLFIYSLSFSCHATQSHSFPVYSLCPCSNPHQKKKLREKRKEK